MAAGCTEAGRLQRGQWAGGRASSTNSNRHAQASDGLWPNGRGTEAAAGEDEEGRAKGLHSGGERESAS